MAAGLGFKDFQTGEVLTAGDVDGYLMQGIWVFADSAARDAAVTSPQEGNFAFLKDTNTTTYYTGSAWTNLDTTGMVNPMTTTGDTIYASSGSTPARLGIGSTGQVLTVSGGVPSWATPAGGGGQTLLETITLSGASVTSSTISGSYNDLVLIIQNFRPVNNGAHLQVRINSDSNTRYINQNFMPQTYNVGFSETAWIILLGQNNNASTQSLGYVSIPSYSNTTTWKAAYSFGATNGDTTSTNVTSNMYKSYYNQTGAITSLTFLADSGNMTSGSVLIYGVK